MASSTEELEEESDVLHILSRHPQDPYASAAAFNDLFICLSVRLSQDISSSPLPSAPDETSSSSSSSLSGNEHRQARTKRSRAGGGGFLFIKNKTKSGARTSGVNEFVTPPPPPGGDDIARAVVYASLLPGWGTAVGGACTKKPFYVLFSEEHNACVCAFMHTGGRAIMSVAWEPQTVGHH